MTRYEARSIGNDICAFDRQERRVIECLSAARRYPTNKGAIRRFVNRLNEEG